MSYPSQPPGTSSSLPPRPPPSIHASTHGFAGFKPRQVSTNSGAPTIAQPPTYSGVPGVSNTYGYQQHQVPDASGAAPIGYGRGYAAAAAPTTYSTPPTMYSAAPTLTSAAFTNPNQPQPQHMGYGQPQQPQQGQQPYHNQAGNQRHNHNRPYQSRTHNNNGNNNNSSYPPLDPEMEAQIAEQQSIYDPARRAQIAAAAAAAAATTPATEGYDPNAQLLPDGTAAPPAAPVDPNAKKATVVRSGGGQTWKDDTLLEWDPAHFRLFVGNLAGEVTDESLLKAFAAYPSVKKARVIRDKRTTKSKGYGFVAFEDGEEYFKAAREMQGKYIGSHPVLLRKSTTEIRPVFKKESKWKKKHKSAGGGAGAGFGAAVGAATVNKPIGASEGGVLGKRESGGVVKKKEKGGLRILG